jgi:3-oxoacyl-[acyl-carrier protein] reductase
MNLKLKDKIVLITGSSYGIGKVIARRFLDEGSKVILTSRKTISKKHMPNNSTFLRVDFQKSTSVERLKNIIKKKFKKIDILICNVGGGKGTRDLIIKKKDWNLSFNKNFITFYNSFNILYSLIDKKNGSIIAISSIAGLETLNAPTEYSVSKTSLISYCKNLSKKLKSGIRINVISPGNVYMKGNNWDKKLKKDKFSVLKYIKNNVPLNRFASPDEIANLALFLSSDLSSFIHGSNIIIDGGQTNKIS